MKICADCALWQSEGMENEPELGSCYANVPLWVLVIGKRYSDGRSYDSIDASTEADRCMCFEEKAKP